MPRCADPVADAWSRLLVAFVMAHPAWRLSVQVHKVVGLP